MTNIAQTAKFDLLIEKADVSLRFPSFEAADQSYSQGHTADVNRIKRIAAAKSLKDRRAAQSGVDPDIDAIERELSKLGYTVFADKNSWGTVFLGIEVRFEEVLDKNSWRYRSTGKFSLFVGDRYDGDGRKRFPEKADGTYSYAKVAEEIVSRYERKVAAANELRIKKQQAASSKELVNQLREEFNLQGYDDTFKAVIGMHPYGKRSEYVEHPAAEGKVWMQLGNMQVTPEQARAVYAVLRELGLKK